MKLRISAEMGAEAMWIAKLEDNQSEQEKLIGPLAVAWEKIGQKVRALR